MELKESIDYLKNCLDDKWDFKNATREKDKQAIDTVLEELNNRISKEEMQNILDAVKLKREKEFEVTDTAPLPHQFRDKINEIIKVINNKE